MNNKKAFYLGGAVLLLLFGGFSFSQFTSALTPYVSYQEAIEATRTVQVAGGLSEGSTTYQANDDGGFLRFTLVDLENETKTMDVRYDGLKPANFEDAISIVAIGQYDSQKEEFAANKLLVKCPSKYQGIDSYETKSYEADSYETDSYETKSYEADKPTITG